MHWIGFVIFSVVCIGVLCWNLVHNVTLPDGIWTRDDYGRIEFKKY